MFFQFNKWRNMSSLKYFNKGMLMKNAIYRVFLVLAICLSFNMLIAVKINYNQEKNCLELIHELEVVEKSVRADQTAQNTIIFVPKAPYQNVKFVITSPTKVCVGEQFDIYLSVQTKEEVAIPFWADLIPDSNQESTSGIKYLGNSTPSIGILNANAQSMLNNGGMGQWQFNSILPANSNQYVSISLQAVKPGKTTYSTLIATNPPSLFPITINGCKSAPIANPDFVNGVQGKSIIIPVLENDMGNSKLEVIKVSEAMYGNVIINSDNTITYTPQNSFVGSDRFTYTIKDVAGNLGQSYVTVNIVEWKSPEIIR